MATAGDDTRYMRRALALARRGLGYTSPNPPVGAVVVRRGRIVGEGYHQGAGGPHGEIHALRSAGEQARGATLYVTLEPCNHFGRTPPCTEAVIAAGIRRVVVAARDPNPKVQGGGAARLENAGIAVSSGVMAAAGDELIAAFRKHITTGMPLVTLKLAASFDGRIATAGGESRWITNERSRRFVHRLRSEHDAIMVGAGTVLADDPELTSRMRGGRNPLRVVIDGRLRIRPYAKVLDTRAAPTLIATAVAAATKVRRLTAGGAQVQTFAGRNGAISIAEVLATLGRRGITSVLLEGGATLAAAALREQVVDRLLLFQAPKLIGGDGKPLLGALGVDQLSEAIVLTNVEVRRFSEDVLLATSVKYR